MFVQFDGEAPPLDQHLSVSKQRFETIDFDPLRWACSWSTSCPCNWKLAVESGIEDYHLPSLHPLVTDGASRSDHSKMESDGEAFFNCVEVSRAPWTEGRGADNLPRLPPIPRLAGDDAYTLFFLNLFPCAVIGMVPNSLYVGIWLPDGHERTSLTFHYCFVGKSASNTHHQPARDDIVSGVREVFSQNIPVVGAAQRHAHTRDELGIRSKLSPFWKTLVHGFQKTVIRHIEKAGVAS